LIHLANVIANQGALPSKVGEDVMHRRARLHV